MYDYLVEAFPRVAADVLRARLVRGDIVDENGLALGPEAPFRGGVCLWYYRELEAEALVPFEARILYRDEHILVADKPHFLPVAPAGKFLRETLLVRLRQETGLNELVPLHRIDRETAGLVLFSLNPESRGLFGPLFAERKIEKTYEALTRPGNGREIPEIYRSRMAAGEPFFRMQEIPGEPNTETRLDILERGEGHWHYRLKPTTGKKHQLRVHLAALGTPILNDRFYPELQDDAEDDYSAPLQLLAKSLRFRCPVSGRELEFQSRMRLGLSD
ncbi:MAG: pseudouridine synthase [Gammaproteobacteria bacterium]|nr:pseudouridine synthase [Gammaproteobacteria bacterium]